MNEFGQECSTQAAVAPLPSPSAGQSREPLPAWDRRTWLVAIPLILIVLYAFSPILDNGFAGGDDDDQFLDNPYFRGLGAAQLKWAWTTTFRGVFQPLAWMLFEAQYVFCQLDPRGYHLTSLLIHVANAVVLYGLTVALLVRRRTDSWLESPWTCSLSAGLATALFAVHPLRVEAVAEAHHQPFLACTLFSMLAILAYLRAFWMSSSPRWGWLVGSFSLFVAALLFKVSAVSLPPVLLILDVYPLRRLGDGTGRWFGASARRILLDKVPFVIVSLLFMGLSVAIREQSPFRIGDYDASEGIAQACYGTWFYILKTAWPVDLVIVYLLPVKLNWLAFPYSLSILATLAMSAGLFLLRRRWPGLLAAWLSYLVLLAPVSGLIRNNSSVIAADRYSYIAMLALVMPAAVCFCQLGRMSSRWRPGAIGIIAIGSGALLVLTAMTRNQCRTWLNSDTPLVHALTHGGNSSDMARFIGAVHNNSGNAFYRRREYEAAAAQFTEAVRLNPEDAYAHYNLGNVLYTQGKYEAAAAHYTEALRLDPGFTDAHNNLATVLSRLSRYTEAEAHFAEALRLNPGFVDVHYNLGVALFSLGNYGAAMAQFAEAIRLSPGDPDAYNASATIMAACPLAKFRDGKEAIRFATRACELTKGKDPRFLNTLAAAHAEAGDYGAAVSAQTRALELVTDQRQRDDYRSRLVLYQAKRPYRQAAPQRAPTEARP